MSIENIQPIRVLQNTHLPCILYRVKVGEKLRSLRKKYKKTQKQVGECLGVSYTQIQKFEKFPDKGSNVLNYNQIIKLCAFFHVDPLYFFDESISEPIISPYCRELDKVSEILKSKGRYARALKENIDAFHHALHHEQPEKNAIMKKSDPPEKVSLAISPAQNQVKRDRKSRAA